VQRRRRCNSGLIELKRSVLLYLAIRPRTRAAPGGGWR
jgi:hypothetical protein